VSRAEAGAQSTGETTGSQSRDKEGERPQGDLDPGRDRTAFPDAGQAQSEHDHAAGDKAGPETPDPVGNQPRIGLWQDRM
jgi:hypothetical protein